MLLASPVVNEVDLSRWKVIIGGSALSPTSSAGPREAWTYSLPTACRNLPNSDLGAAQTAHAGLGRNGNWTSAARPVCRCHWSKLRVVDEMNDLPHDGKTPGEVVVPRPG